LKQTGKIALGGVLGGLSLTFLVLTIFPLGTYALPAIAGAMFIPFVIEFSPRSGFMVYAAVAIVSLFITPDIEAKILFIGFFGYYPILKSLLESLTKRWIEWIIKLAVFNISVILSYLLLVQVFNLDIEISFSGVNIVYVVLAVGNAVFLLYDKALTNVISLYIRVLHPRIVKTFKLN
jgi:hypothetical protein